MTKSEEIKQLKRALSQDLDEWDDIQENWDKSPYWESRCDLEANIRYLTRRLLNLI